MNALIAAGKNIERLKIEDLAPIDQFHVRGRNTTVELSRDLTIDKHMQILNVECGIRGPSRYLADEFGCRVTGSI